MNNFFSWENRSAFAMPFFYMFSVVMALAFRFSPDSSVASYTHMVIFMLGPILVLFDMFKTMQPTRHKHHLETAFRVTLLLLLYSTILPGVAAPETKSSILGYLFNFVAMYFSVVLGLHKFVIRPNHWLRYDNRFHIAFLTILVATVLVELGLFPGTKGLGLWEMAFLTTGLQIAWRHALWYNASQEMAPSQHADVWPTMAKNIEAPQFWANLYKYTLQYPSGMPGHALGALSLPMLLGYFSQDTAQYSNTERQNHDFEENVKSAINALEPRATFIWQLYPAREAAELVARVDEFVAAAQTESLELPAL